MIGIYRITNKINNKVYIGQSWDIEHRWNAYRRGIAGNDHIKAAQTKYGNDSFEFEILHELVDQASQEELDLLEVEEIARHCSLDPARGYNLKTGGKGGKHSESSKKKMSESSRGRKQTEAEKKLRSDIWKQRGHPRLGTVHSDEVKSKMAAAKLGKKRKPFSEEHRRRLSEANTRRWEAWREKKEINNGTKAKHN